MNKKSKEIVKKLCFTLVIVISIITIIGCPNTVSNKANSESTEQNKPNPPPTDPWKITVEGAGTNREVKVCLKKWDSDPEEDLELSLTEAESKLKEWIEGSAGDDAEIEVTFIVKNCYFTHTMTILTLIYKFYNSILSINLRVYTLKFPCT